MTLKLLLGRVKLVNENNVVSELVSIIMPAYNCEKFIEDSIESVISQEYSNWELIIIDDCSNDNTSQVIEKYCNYDSRIKYYKNEINKGVSFTRNRAIQLSKGTWIAFLDSDDIWSQDKLVKQLKFAVSKQVNFIFTAATFIDTEGERYNYVFNVPYKVNYRQLLKQNVISCSSVLIRKEMIVNHKMENDSIHEDFGAWLKILRTEEYAYGIDEPLLIYRISKNSKSGNKIKSLAMTYGTYRFAGINHFLSMYYIVWYSLNGIKKYRSIYKNSKNSERLSSDC